MMCPWSHAHLAVVRPEDSLLTVDLDAQRAFKYFHVLILVRVEVQRRLLRGQLHELGVREEEGHLEGEGTVRMLDYAGDDGTIEATRRSSASVEKFPRTVRERTQ